MNTETIQELTSRMMRMADENLCGDQKAANLHKTPRERMEDWAEKNGLTIIEDPIKHLRRPS